MPMQSVNRAFACNNTMHSDKAKLFVIYLKEIQINVPFLMLLYDLSSKRLVIIPVDIEDKVS